MSSTADMEGPGGSFECVQQTGPPRGSLEVLGSIPYKVRVRANDDVYEATRHRMTIAEENHKNKCTREIKPNEKDIGRKVKLKQNRTSLPPIRRDPPPIQRDSLPKPSYQSNLPSKQPAAAVISSSNGLSNGLGSNHVSSSRPQLNKPSVPDIARRPIKERLIHLLALRPFKKVELHDRITKEGVREKNGITSILKQISFMKDNCYHLNRAMWNEVNEEWPFYTESERQMLKRRKPQNLTPPGSSDGGSSGSGQSPTSTHPGSPPPITTSSSKRPGYYDNQDGLPTKRQRISHYRKPSEQPTYRSPVENNSQRRPVTDSRDASNMNPRSRESPTLSNGYSTPNGGYPPSNGYVTPYADKRNFSDDGDDRKRSCDSHSLSYGIGREKTFGGGAGDCRNGSPQTGKTDSGYANGAPVPNGKCKEKERGKYDRVTSSSQRSVRVSPDSQSEAIGNNESVGGAMVVSPVRVKSGAVDSSSEFPDYLTEYTRIKDAEQRRRFKADFNADYAEYKDLHGIVEKVSRRFVNLESMLKQEDASSPRFKDLKKQIVREYNENKKDLEHQKLKRRFQYLHDKLSHIKRLVLEYDQGLSNNQY
ncbi:hypothetical protein Zmor_028049 [Zophobas morio]|uniref:OCEL domain-containing protein n=2 Tax=Zophobas morio TaxID=2755281 RepID=A0AA38HR02_9CUCU|nr:hypothetical protein Zmor_028049 [Zophobas morio]